MKIVLKTSLFFLFFLILGCKTYYISVESFKALPKGDIGKELDYIICQDKDGNITSIKNDGSVEIRITDKNNKRKTGYFRNLLINDTIVIYGKSVFFSSKNVVRLDDIVLIELQNAKRGLRNRNDKSLPE